MRVLFDHGTPRGMKRFLTAHSVTEARDEGWDAISNGELLAAAEQAGYDVLLTTDKNIRYQQNLVGRKIAIVVLGRSRWSVVKPVVSRVVAAVDAATEGSFGEVEISESRLMVSAVVAGSGESWGVQLVRNGKGRKTILALPA